MRNLFIFCATITLIIFEMKRKMTITGVGCALADFIYTGIRFDTPRFKRYLSKKTGDGGLSPGKLVFTDELERFSGVPYPEILSELSGTSSPDAVNLGGPGLVSFIHASQMLPGDSFDVRFYGSLGNDETAEEILALAGRTPLNVSGYIRRSNKPTPFTHVLSDPHFADGHGERTFVNNIGAAWDLTPSMLDDDFFDAGIICFGGTALVPGIHDNLTDLLRRSKQSNAITLVNTVFDFRNEKSDPEKPWPLAGDNGDYSLIDVLIMDREEALKISGQHNEKDAANYFAEKNVSSFFITNGANEILAFSGGGLFRGMEISAFPVSRMVTPELRSAGDTTGCGDNFAGGIISSLAMQAESMERGRYDLVDALSWAVASGGYACSYVGGTYFEKHPGEKLEKIREFRNDYLHQTGYQFKQEL